MVTQRAEVYKTTVTGGGGGLSGTVAYLGPIDCSRATSLLVDLDYTKVGVNLTIGVVELRDDSGDATIATKYMPRPSSLSSAPGTLAETHSITATATRVMVVNTGGLAGRKCYVAATLSGAGVAGDTLSLSAVISEGV